MTLLKNLGTLVLGFIAIVFAVFTIAMLLDSNIVIAHAFGIALAVTIVITSIIILVKFIRTSK